MSNVYLFGYGNLGRHLTSLFLSRGIKVAGIFSEQQHDNTSIAFFGRQLVNEKLQDGDILFVTCKDDSLVDVLQSIQNNRVYKIICSGAAQISDFNGVTLLGVWYPLYSFSRDLKIDWSKVPVFIEYTDEQTGKILKQLNLELGIKSKTLNSENRSKLHLAAVFANNFVNACLIATSEILNGSEQINFSDLLPIIEQTIEKVKDMSPLDCQTGPAKRNDLLTMKRHMDMLNSMLDEKDVYVNLSKYIQQKIKK